MRHVKRLAVALTAATALLAAPAPAHAAEAATAAISGDIYFGGAMSSSTNWLGFGAVVTGAMAGTQPQATAGSWSMATSGESEGICGVWSGWVRGTMWPLADLIGNGKYYEVVLAVTAVGGVLTISGTSLDRNGAFGIVTGSAVATQLAGPPCIPGAALAYQHFSFHGSLTLAG